MSYLIHVVIEGGGVGEDVYLGPFRYEDRAELAAARIERAAARDDVGLTALVRELRPAGTSASAVVEEV